MLYVSHSVLQTYRRIAHRYGLPNDETKPIAGITLSDSAANHAILLSTGQLDEDTVVHEVKHAAEEVMKAIGHKGCKCGEPDAYLLGFIQKWVKKQLKVAGLEVV